ncbi:MAG: MaoC family dehydratase N-terminal domain-containing protein [Proteobacteria bacterium]|nr:MaoC family dehydratase N-terminal domain-containing protein [Pseudomonadota bacterium]
MIQQTEKGVASGTRRLWVNVATRDSIRHFAWGTGDDNPLWINVDYASASRWGDLIAPPCFLYAIDETSVAPGHPDRRRIYRSVDWMFFDVVRVGTHLVATALAVDEKNVDGVLEQSGRVDFHSNAGVLLASAETTCLRPMELASAIEDRPEVRYSGEDLNAIERTILGESRQGAVNRIWEETKIGDETGPLLKGPLSIMDVVAWSAATSGVVTDEFEYSEGGLHAETATGPEQVSWMSQLVTDWMGDDAFLHKLNIVVEDRPPLGATTGIIGRVAALELVKNRPAARLDMSATNQDGQRTAYGTAVVFLPSSKHGPVTLPAAP